MMVFVGVVEDCEDFLPRRVGLSGRGSRCWRYNHRVATRVDRRRFITFRNAAIWNTIC